MVNVKEDQIVIGIGILMKMGYRYTTKYFQEMLLDSNTFIPFMLEIADIYEVNSVTL